MRQTPYQKYEIQLGTVIAVGQEVDAYGTAHPAVYVKSAYDGGLIPIQLAPAAWEQSMPVAGSRILFVRQGNHATFVIKIFGTDPDTARKGTQFGLEEGEVFIQSATGYGYLKIDKYGQITLTTGDQTSDIQLNGTGAHINSTQFEVITQSGLVFNLTQDGTINLQKLSSDGSTVKSQILVDKDGNLFISSEKDVSIKAQNIYLDGKVWLGQGSTDANTRVSSFGDVVSGGPTGTSPLTPAPGAPLLGSGAVKAAK